MIRRHAAGWLGLALLLGGAAAFAQDYVRSNIDGTDTCIFWNVRGYTYHVDAAGSQRTPGTTEFDAIDAAYQSWQTVSDLCSDFQFTKGDPVTDPQVGYVQGASDNENVITFRETSCDTLPPDDPCFTDDTCANEYRCWSHDPSIIALTTTTYDTKTGEILDADIELNAAPDDFGGPGFLFTTVSSPPCTYSNISTDCVAYDVQAALTHEIGHSIGLAHVFDNPDSTMAPTAGLGQTGKRIIDIGTATGFCDIYPRGQPSSSACDLTGQQQDQVVAASGGTFGALGCDAAGGSPWGLWLAGIAALVACAWRRR